MKRFTLAILLLAGWMHSAWADVYPPGGKAEAAWTFSYLLEDTDVLDGVPAAMMSHTYSHVGVAYGGNPFFSTLFPVPADFRLTDGHEALNIDWADTIYGPRDFYRIQERLDFELTRNTRLTVTGVITATATAPTDDTFVPGGWPWPVRIKTTARAMADVSLHGSFVSVVADSSSLRQSEAFRFSVETGAHDWQPYSLHAGMDVAGDLSVVWLDAQPVPEPASLALLFLGLPLVLGVPARNRRRAWRAAS